MSYFRDIQDGIRTTLKGLSLTFRHLCEATHRRMPVGVDQTNYFEQQNGLVTLQYPHEQLPIPDNGRYRLRNEIEDCIVCDKCAKICPVDCITIDAIKATEEVGRASDGSPIRLYAATFDIDMAKCCYCGLCTVVCPTECLTMDKKFDYSEFELGRLTYSFAELTPEEANEKRALYEQYVREKEEAKAAQLAAKAPMPAADVASAAPANAAAPAKPRPVFRPTAKPAAPATTSEIPADAVPENVVPAAEPAPAPKPRPVFRPTQKPVSTQATETETNRTANPAPADSSTKEPAVRPEQTAPNSKPKPAFRPTMKPPKPAETPAAASSPVDSPVAETPAPNVAESVEAAAPKPKPAFRPSMKPKPVLNSEEKEARKPVEEQNSAGGALTHPVTDATPDEMEQIAEAGRESVGLPDDAKVTEAPPAEAPKPKPTFRPTMKPK